MTPSTPHPPAPSLGLLLRMTRPGFLLVTFAACLLGLATAAFSGVPLALPQALATVLLALMAHAGANVLNDYHDARNGADEANTEGLFPFSGGSRLIQQGAVSLSATGRWAAVLLLLLVPGGLWLTWYSGPGLIGIGLAGLLLAWAYSAPPLQLMCRGLGELAVGLAWWLMVIGADYVQRQAFAPLPAVAGLGLALLLANILVINGFPDARADASVGKRTLVVRLSLRGAAWCYLALGLMAHGWLVWAVGQGWAPSAVLGGLLSLPLSLVAAGLLIRQAETPARLRPAIGLTIAAATVHALAMAATLVWAIAGKA